MGALPYKTNGNFIRREPYRQKRKKGLRFLTWPLNNSIQIMCFFIIQRKAAKDMEFYSLYQDKFEAIRKDKEMCCLERGHSIEFSEIFAEAFASACVETYIEVILTLLNEHTISLPIAKKKLQLSEDFTNKLLEEFLIERYLELPQLRNVTICDLFDDDDKDKY